MCKIAHKKSDHRVGDDMNFVSLLSKVATFDLTEKKNPNIFKCNVPFTKKRSIFNINSIFVTSNG